MFGEILKTLVRIVMLFVFLLLAFALGFHALMLNQVREGTNDSVKFSLTKTRAFVEAAGVLTAHR